MPLLSKEEIVARKLVIDGEDPDKNKHKSWRATTHDSRVGTIITKSGIFDKGIYYLKPRSIVWLVSAEIYSLPPDVTGLTTLKTGLTKNGLLTVTAGIVDPNYHGPISTVVINFSQKDYPIRVGDTFFRTAFFSHAETAEKPVRVEKDEYIHGVVEKTTSFSDTFLTLNTLAVELSREMFRMPRIPVKLGLAGVALALLALLAPPAWSVYAEIAGRNAEISEIRGELNVIRRQLDSQASSSEESAVRLLEIDTRLENLKDTVDHLADSDSRRN